MSTLHSYSTHSNSLWPSIHGLTTLTNPTHPACILVSPALLLWQPIHYNAMIIYVFFITIISHSTYAVLLLIIVLIGINFFDLKNVMIVIQNKIT